MKRIALAAALAAFSVMPTLAAEGMPGALMVDYVPRSTPPKNVPADMNVTCANTPEFTALAVKCPVIRYQGMTTWVFSYKDNRWSMALVTYDEAGNIVRNVEKKGARYIVNAVSSPRTQTVTLSGQASKIVVVPWSEFGK